MNKEPTFAKELTELINKHSIDAELSMPDIFVSGYLIDSLGALRELKIKLLHYGLKND